MAGVWGRRVDLPSTLTARSLQSDLVHDRWRSAMDPHLFFLTGAPRVLSAISAPLHGPQAARFVLCAWTVPAVADSVRSMRHIPPVLLAVLALGLPVSPAMAGPPTARAGVVERIIAVVDHDVILLSELQKRARPFYAQLARSIPEGEVAKRGTAEQQVRVAGGAVDVTVVVHEGIRARVAAIDIEGVSKAFEKDLRALIDTHGGQYNKVGAPYWPASFERSILNMNVYYHDRGRIEAHVANAEVAPSQDGSTLTLKVKVREGPVYRVGKIRCKGDFAGTERDCLRLVGLKTGKVFNRTELFRGVERVRGFQTERARGTSITPVNDFDPKKLVINIDLRFER